MRILICEGGEMLISALKFRLQKKGFEVVLATKKSDAGNQIIEQVPDLIVLDVDLPGFSEGEIETFIKERKRQEVPIILLGRLDHGDFVLSAINLGANDFIIKPIKPVELILRIQKVFQEKKLVNP
ncbi:MAG: response regulator transcription factor [Saprospiraceae bacterium]|nr:response regulator transcription factor [Saprospiraceae bacterium]